MKLTGKCKEEFLKYLDVEEQWFNEEYTELFENALVVDFFDSVGIYIDCGYYTKGKMCSGVEGSGLEFISTGTNHNSRIKATNKAIIKANEIYNLKINLFLKL